MATIKEGERYIAAVGRRKTSVARVRLMPGGSDFTVNEKPVDDFFKTRELRAVAREALEKLELSGKFGVSAKTSGGGTSGQAEAVRLGVARALIAHDPELRPALKKLGFLTRDPRMVERKHFGLKKARKASQWSKR